MSFWSKSNLLNNSEGCEKALAQSIEKGRSIFGILIWPVISCVLNRLISENRSVFSIGLVEGISDSERSY